MLEFLDRISRLERRVSRYLPEPEPERLREATPSPIDGSLLNDLTGEHLEPFQRSAWAALQGPQTNVLLYGGSGGGKTHVWLYWLMLRAMACPSASHTILRFRFNSLKASIIDGTLPKVCGWHWPGQTVYTLNRSDWYIDVIGGGRIYFGGLDEKARTEKILGQEHSTVILNETSQISYGSFLKVSTRVRQPSGLSLKLVCDENPPGAGHWTERLWVKGLEPSTGKPLENPEDYVSLGMHPKDNPHLPDESKKRQQKLPPRERVRFWEGVFAKDGANSLWSYESIESARIDEAPTLGEIIVVVDPSGCHGPEDKRSDEVGIVVEGIADGVVYLLEDASGRMGPSGPEGWGSKVIELATRWGADRVVAETNFGGAMVGAVLHTARYERKDGRVWEGSHLSFREVVASRGKHVRAEPVATLTDRGRLRFVGHFPELEEQLIAFSSAGYSGDRSPDRADAFVWGAHALGVIPSPGEGYRIWLQEEAEAAVGAKASSSPATTTAPTAGVTLDIPARFLGSSCFVSQQGTTYQIEAGQVRALPAEVDDLIGMGFTLASNTLAPAG